VKIKSLTIQGFRGFNEERTIDFNDRLTIIYAPNSYGKTSVSEAMEWLLYQITSKVEKADSKDEYKGSYRNRHLPSSKTPYVKATFKDGENKLVFMGELYDDDSIKKYICIGEKKEEVESWPLPQDIYDYPHPFILQHALKYLLLSKPDERFQGFARILGLEVLDNIQRDVISLCTAADRKVPPEVSILQNKVSVLASRLKDSENLQSIKKAFKRKDVTFDQLSGAIYKECFILIPENTDKDAILPQLLKMRKEKVGKVFKGNLSLSAYTQTETNQNEEDVQKFNTFLTEILIKEYSELIALANVDWILKQAQFLDLGNELWKAIPQICPFCDLILNEETTKHIIEKHKNIKDQAKISDKLVNQKSRISDNIDAIKKRLSNCHERHIAKTQPLLELENSLDGLKLIFTNKNEAWYKKFNSIFIDLKAIKQKLDDSYKTVNDILAQVQESIETSTENINLIHSFGDALVNYASTTRVFSSSIIPRVTILENIDQILQHELDVLAQTEDISLLIDFIDNLSDIKKKIEIDRILGSLKDLRTEVDKFVAEKMLFAISGELTCGVREWYDQIKTTTDPDVHFDGFDMERNLKGEVRARRVKIKARSYDQELVSAVSSLSESKLNALGLCVSIANCLKGQSIFDFLIIDDPIQSLDTEHEAQFVNIVRNLVEKCHKQVILLSHNRPWLDQVKDGCRFLNGCFYEFTGYTKVGPHISVVDWENWQGRLKVIKSILDDPGSNTIRLQQAEEEIRIAVAEITSKIYAKVKGVKKSPHDLNSAKVIQILIECGVDKDLISRIGQTFSTTDDSHHAPQKYFPTRDRIMKYYSWVQNLSNYLN
jgi:hypothetical protein